MISTWSESYDEIEELKKVFFEFLKRWVENDGSQQNVNQPKLYERQPDWTQFNLQFEK